MDFDLSLKGKCILSAEDNEVNQIVLEHTLSEQSLPFVIVENGAEAFEAWKQLDPVIILMDISMPVMDGTEATEKLRQTHSKGQLPIVAMTAHAGDEHHNRFIAVGMNSVMSKPIDLLQLSKQDIRNYRGSELAMIFQEPMTSLNPVFTCGHQITESILLHQNVTNGELRYQCCQKSDA